MRLTAFLCCLFLCFNPSGLSSGVNGGRDVEASGGGELLICFSFNKGNSFFFSHASRGKQSSKNRPSKFLNSTGRLVFPASRVFRLEKGGKANFKPINPNLNAFPKVLRLLSPGSPSAVSRSVMAVSPYSVKSEFSRSSLSHISKELLKGLVEKLNATSSVVFVFRIFRTFAPSLGRPVAHVRRAFTHSVGSPFRCLSILKAPATLNVWPNNASRGNSLNSSAFALYVPRSPLKPGGNTTGITKNSKHFDFLAGKVSKSPYGGGCSKHQFAFLEHTHYNCKTQNPPDELLLHNEGIRPELIQLKGGFRDEGTVSKSNPLCSPAKIQIKTSPKGLNTNKITLI